MLIHTWAATLRWDWPSNSCTEDLKPFLPVYLFLFFIDLSDIFGFDHYFWVCFTDFWDTLTLPRAGWRSDPPSLVYRKSLKGLHKRLVKHPFPLLLRQFHPFQCKHVLCYFFYFFFCLSYNLCFCCKWISVFFSVLQCVKMNGFTVTRMLSRQEKVSSICCLHQKSGLRRCSFLIIVAGGPWM